MSPHLTVLEAHRCHSGGQGVYRHTSTVTETNMTFAVYLPPAAETQRVPALLYLSGLTCTWENVIAKAGAQAACAEHGIAFIAPDTSPRGLDLPGEHEAYDFGSGAGFYLDATVSPWDRHYRMESYVTVELLDLVGSHFSIDMTRLGITGHSMGGHGALTLALKHPQLFKSISAFAPISAPMVCPWGKKALGGYLGDDRTAWRRHDACALIEDGARVEEILVDQGLADPFLEEQLKPELLEAACAKANIALTLRRQAGYDHSYYFITSFIADHVAYHARHLML